MMVNKGIVLGIRHNPQLGSYLSFAKIAVLRFNKRSITATFFRFGDEYAETKRFDLHDVDGKHFCKDKDKSLYGSFEYVLFTSKEHAIVELKHWQASKGSSKTMAEVGLKLVKDEKKFANDGDLDA